MDAILRFLQSIELWLYLLLGIVGIWQLRRLILGLVEWRNAMFGLERDNAQRRVSDALSVLAVVVLMAIGEFFLVSFVAPNYTQLDLLPTPTIDLLATATVTLEPAGAVVNADAAAGSPTAEGTILPTAVNLGSPGCVAGKVQFTYPSGPGEELQGIVYLRGIIDVPDFGFYKYEYAAPGSDTWNTISAGDQLRTGEDQDLPGAWDTSQLPPGEYRLRLVVTDHAGNELLPCEVSVQVQPF